MRKYLTSAVDGVARTDDFLVEAAAAFRAARFSFETAGDIFGLPWKYRD